MRCARRSPPKGTRRRGSKPSHKNVTARPNGNLLKGLNDRRANSRSSDPLPLNQSHWPRRAKPKPNTYGLGVIWTSQTKGDPLMATTQGRKTNKAEATFRPSRQPAKKASAAKKPAKRYKATPANMSDKEHLIALIREVTGCTAKPARILSTA